MNRTHRSKNRRAVGDVSFDKFKPRMTRRVFQIFQTSTTEIIHTNNFVVRFQQPFDQVAPYKPCGAGDKNAHGGNPIIKTDFPIIVSAVMFDNMTLRFTLIALILCAASSAWATSNDMQKSLGRFGNWHAFVFQEKGHPVCTMELTVTPVKDKKFKRGLGHLMITHRPVDSSRDVISFTSGYVFKAESPVKITIGKNKFELFTTHDTAWARDAVTDHRLVAILLKASTAMVTGTPVTKIKTLTSITDHINLAGATKAYQAIGKACAN